MAVFRGNAHNNTFDGTSGDDTFLLWQGGNDTVTGGAGNDVFRMGAAFNAADSIDGGADTDTVALNGDYSFTWLATTITNVEVLKLGAGHDYSFVSNDANVAAGASLTIKANTLGAGDTLTFDGSAETDGHFRIAAGAGNDVLTGGGQADVFRLEAGGNDTVNGGGGGDRFFMGASLTAADHINGGAGFNQMYLDGDYTGAHAVVFGATTMTNVEYLSVAAGHSYDLTANNNTVAAGAALTVDGSALGAGDSLHFDGTHELNSTFILVDGLGNDVLKGGNGIDLFSFDGGGTDTGLGGGGDDFVDACGHLDSTDHFDGGTGYDAMELTADETSTGNYTGANALHLTATMMAHFEQLDLDPGGSYDITTVDANVDAGVDFVVDGSFLGPTDSLGFNGAAETDGSFSLIDGLGNDVLIGGAGDDFLSFDGGGTDHGVGGAGDDFVDACGHLDATDQFDGGGDYDTIELTADETSTGNYTGINALHLTGPMMAHFEEMDLDSGGSYDITTVDANVDTGVNFLVDATFLSPANSLTFNGAAELDGSFSFRDGAGNDVLTGSQGNDTFDIGGGGNDVVDGQGGNDLILAVGAFTAADHVNGGSGFDTLDLDGVAGTVSFTAATMQNVEVLVLGSGHNYTLILNDGNVASGETLKVDASTLLGGDSASVDGGNESNGAFDFVGGAGFNHFIGGDGADAFDVSVGGTYSLDGGAGGNNFEVGAHLAAGDIVNGGADSDTMILDGDYSGGFTFDGTDITSIETFQLAAANSYNLTFTDDYASGSTTTVDGSVLGVGDALVVDASAETDSSYVLTGGAGDDIFTIGGPAVLAGSTIDGGTGGDDTLTLVGDYSAGYSLGTGISNIGTLFVAGGDDYDLISTDSNVAAGQTLSVYGLHLSAGDSLTFDGSAESDGAFYFNGGFASNNLTGGDQGDTFDFIASGASATATIHGGAGGDTAIFAGNFTAADAYDGGSGYDSLGLNGDYSSGLNFGATTLTNVEEIDLAGSHSYMIVTDDATVAAGQTLTVDASQLGAADSLTFDGSTELDGSFTIYDGGGNDVLTGSQGDDTFDIGRGGNDIVHGQDGDDLILAAGTFTAADQIDGGNNFDTLDLNGVSGPVVFTATTMQNVEALLLEDGHDYTLILDDGNVANGATLTVNGSALSAGNAMTLDGSAETDGHFELNGGAGDDTLIGGAQSDTLTGGLGADQLSGGGGGDYFNYYSVAASTGDAHDTITSVNFDSDTFLISSFATLPGVIDTAVASGTLDSGANFDTELASAIGSGQLGANEAVLFTATSGNDSGHTFLIVDVNGTTGYQAGQDLVFDVTGFSGTLTTADFS